MTYLDPVCMKIHVQVVFNNFINIYMPQVLFVVFSEKLLSVEFEP